MDRALREYRIRGVATNLAFLEALLEHPRFLAGDYTTRFIDETPELFQLAKGRPLRPTSATSTAIPKSWAAPGRAPTPAAPEPPQFGRARPVPRHQALLDRLGPQAFAAWMREQTRAGHRHHHARRAAVAARHPHAHLRPGRLRRRLRPRPAAAPVAECWGGATFDVAMRFLTEDPWERLALLRERVLNLLLQMLLRGANGVGYTNYPDNVVRFFVKQAAEAGMDLFRIFDCLNWVENMRVSIDAVGEAGKLAEGAMLHRRHPRPGPRQVFARYYVGLAKELEAAGCHILGVKDMAGLLKPAAARALIKALKDEVGLPIHFHTHDTSGIAGASVLAAVEAGVDAVDAAMDAMSGLTSQPCLGSIVEALRHTERDTGLDPEAIRQLSFYWEAVRAQYAAFESDLRAGASEVYLHEMPGGQFTNLKEQARALGLETRWHEVARAYRAANDMFGDIVKVTLLQGRGRHGAAHGGAGPDPAEVADPPARSPSRPPWSRCSTATLASHPAAGRRPAEEGAQGRDADHRPPGLAPSCRPTSRPKPPRARSAAAASSTRTSRRLS